MIRVIFVCGCEYTFFLNLTALQRRLQFLHRVDLAKEHFHVEKMNKKTFFFISSNEWQNIEYLSLYREIFMFVFMTNKNKLNVFVAETGK